MGHHGARQIADVRRGDGPDHLEVILDDGAVLLLHAHGVHEDEQIRTREAVLKLLIPLLGRSA